MNIPRTDLPRVVIIGGGFAGMSLMRNLLKKEVQLVILDKHNYHTFQPLLYQVSTSGLEPDSIAYPLRKITRGNKNAIFRLAEVKSISGEENIVSTSIGDLAYDYLVIATGSKTNFFGNKSIEENGMWMKTVPQALNIRSLILENLEQAVITDDPEKRKALLNFVLVGAGPTGVELSGAISELRNHIVPKDYPDIDINEMNIHLLEGLDRVLPPMSENASEKAHKFLEELGVHIHLNTMVESYDGHLVTTNTDLKIKTETFIWSAGVTGAPVKGLNASAMVEKANRYEVNAFNQVNGYENVFAIGDIALMQTKEYPKGHPMVAQPAIQQGKHLAKNLIRLIKGEQMEAFSYHDKGTMATVGRNRAVVDLGKMKFSGFSAWFVWMFVHLWFLIGFRNRLVTFFNWVYNYINYDKAARLIIRPFKGYERKMKIDKEEI
ncbi:MAG TPA: NAD(P)/FAD-dependent oxidoreductase [Salegentibacter sp.]|nr:NAD(P)/FAD-dependent oxidoreductase [Salegentibacter sp.]